MNHEKKPPSVKKQREISKHKVRNSILANPMLKARYTQEGARLGHMFRDSMHQEGRKLDVQRQRAEVKVADSSVLRFGYR